MILFGSGWVSAFRGFRPSSDLKRGCQGPGLSDSFGSGIVSALGGIRVSRLLVFVRLKMRMPGPGLVASLRPNGNMFHDARPGPAGLAAAADLAS